MDLVIAVLLFALFAVVLYWRRGLVFLILANRAFRRNDAQATLSWFKKAWQLRQVSPDLVASYSYQLLKAGRPEEAGELLETMLNEGWKKKPLKASAQNQLRTYQSLVLWKRGRLPEAIDLLTSLHASGYTTATLYGNLGWFLLEAGRMDEAEKVCTEAHSWAPTGKVILDNLAALRLRQGDLEGAQEHYEALLALDPKFPEAWYGAAQVALKLENPEVARELLEHALTLPFNALTTVSRDEVESTLSKIEK